MKKIKRIFTIVGFAACVGWLGASSLRASDAKSVILGYYPSWETGVTPAKINYKLFTHLAHSFVDADKDGNLKMEGNMPSADLTTRAHAAGVKVLLSLGGENSGKSFFNDMGRNPKATQHFVQSVTDLLLKYHYDGIDMDWEFPESKEDGKNLTAMMVLFKDELAKRAPNAIMTMALNSGDWVGKYFDAKTLSSIVAFGNVMTYDFHGPWGSNGHNAPLYPVAGDKTEESGNVIQGMDYWAKTRKWPAAKLLVGIPCFGHGFVGEWYGKPKEKTKYSDFHFSDSLKLVKEGWEKRWDSEAAVPYLASKDGSEFISYDDEKSVGLKADWAKKMRFPGIFFWEITEDFVNGDNLLVKAARKAYLGE